MSTHRDREQPPRYLSGVLDVDGTLYRITRTPVILSRHPSGTTTLAVDSTTIRQLGAPRE